VEEDDRWWEFEALSKSIQQQVVQGTARDDKDRTILADVAEFTYLQRLFRAAFHGQLGERFAVERLLALAEATAPAGPSATRTLRWEMREGPCEVVAASTWLQVLGRYLPRLDPAWQPAWLDRLGDRKPLEEAAFADVLGEWSAEWERQLSRLPGGDEPRLRWCRDTLAVLEPYRQLITEAAREHRRFKQATERLAQRPAKGGDGPETDAWRREWEKELAAWAQWQNAWGQRWEQARALHPFRPYENLHLNGKDKGADGVDALLILVRLVEQVHAAREIRQALGVARDEKQTLDERISPLPDLDR
jgi:hypothetical protein